ncbi:MAG: response regulator transcription factor [Verrucomicrobia bacterium]|nr:MAG: response regulator transcription factor [Verrucomicrobiota bacterium]
MTPLSTPEARAAVPSPTATTTVAVVEDDPGLRRTLERMLNLSTGFRCVCSCGSAEEALKAIPRTPPDVVLMDIHLPNRSGIECTALLRQQMPGLQIIILTVYDDAATLFKALRAGACGYLLKRARPEEILEAIREAQRGGAPMSSEIARQVVAAFEEPTPVAGPDDALSRREHEILDHLLRGFANKEIATRLSISVFTVKNHLRHIYEKLHVRSRTEVLLKFRDARGETDGRPARG